MTSLLPAALLTNLLLCFLQDLLNLSKALSDLVEDHHDVHIRDLERLVRLYLSEPPSEGN
jgi:hypothetical protein